MQVQAPMMRLWRLLLPFALSCSTAAAAKSGRFVEELTALTFEERIVQVLDDEKPPYTPIVMFHMPWCEHCRKTIPELKETAEKVADAADKGQLRQYPAVPKLFMLSCSEPGAEPICANYTGKSYPSIIVFRDGRKMKFNRPRLASVITWWTFRVTRPAIARMESKKTLQSVSENEVAFVLNVPSASEEDAMLVHAWEQLGLDYIEEYSFYFTLSSSPLGKSLGAAPSLSVHAPASLGLKPLPLQSDVNEDTMKAWVKQNQFPPVTDAGPVTMQPLIDSHLKVVTLLYGRSAAEQKTQEAFKKKALELRQNSSYVFATINSTDEENAYFLQNKFPVMYTSGTPRIFVFAGTPEGELHYWENPKLTQPEVLDAEAIELLVSDAEAFQDESTYAWFKSKRKIIFRFAGSSWLGLAITIIVPLSCLSCTWCCCKTMYQALFDDEDIPLEPVKQD